RRIVGHATDLVHRQGFRTTSIEDVIGASAVTKGSFYFHFSSKEELGYAVIEQAASYVLAGLRALAHNEELTHSARLDAMLALIRDVIESHDCRRGCILGNLALEMSDSHDGYRLRLESVFSEWCDLFGSLLRQMQLRGELDDKLDVAAYATHMISSLEGGILLSKVKRDASPLRIEIDHLRRELEAHRIKEE
ncbi:MAG: TetR family transcriptional regulator, partial [Deltaproteobacteria bacterium HGW-Deltaproteobacteria-17]